MASRKAITDHVAAEGRADLTAAETQRFQQLSDEIDNLDRTGFANPTVNAVRRATASVSVNEPRTYAPRNGRSYLQDLIKVQRGMDDTGEASSALMRHAQDVAREPEYRDLDRATGTGGYFSPPAWLVSQYVELARAGRVYADLATQQPLPAGASEIKIPVVSTGTTTAIQTADNQPVSETDLTDSVISAPVKTIAGQQDVAIQLLDQSPINFDEVIFRDLIADYATKVDLQVISGSNGSGQVKGIRSAGITTVTATSGSDNVSVVYSKIADAVQRIHTSRFLAPSAIVMHPRRWAWLTAAVDSSKRPLVLPAAGAQNPIATMGNVTAEGAAGQLQGLPVYLDSNLPTTLGTGTNEDVIHVLRASDLLLYESNLRSRVLPDVGSGTLTVRLQVFNYVAFTAERHPASIVEIGGTALTTPVF